MKQSEISLMNMPDILTTCIVLPNSYVVNNNQIEDEWIVEAYNKSIKRVSKGETQEGNELREKIDRFPKVKINVIAREDFPIVDEVNNVTI